MLRMSQSTIKIILVSGKVLPRCLGTPAAAHQTAETLHQAVFYLTNLHMCIMVQVRVSALYIS